MFKPDDGVQEFKDVMLFKTIKFSPKKIFMRIMLQLLRNRETMHQVFLKKRLNDTSNHDFDDRK